jgi:protease-4
MFSSLTQMIKSPQAGWLRGLGSLVLLVVFPLALGGVAAAWLLPRPAVGIIRLNVEIWSGSAFYLHQQVEEARSDPRIRAVVVQIDSPGGEVVATQNIYLDLKELRQEMPVVGSIDSWAASGAFYAAMATDPIYARPSSDVGNMGVWSYFPPTLGVDDVVLASGPFKLTASNYDEFLRNLEGVRQEFLSTVTGARGERLKISPVDLSQGLTYPGREAAELGLIDAVGSQSEAVEQAASLAKIANYEVIDLAEVVNDKFYSESASQAQAEVSESLPAGSLPAITGWYGAADPHTGERRLPPGLYLLYDVRLRRGQ